VSALIHTQKENQHAMKTQLVNTACTANTSIPWSNVVVYALGMAFAAFVLWGLYKLATW
jgi:hypothetical protein